MLSAVPKNGKLYKIFTKKTSYTFLLYVKKNQKMAYVNVWKRKLVKIVHDYTHKIVEARGFLWTNDKNQFCQPMPCKNIAMIIF